MAKITDLIASEILDSRGNPTLKVIVKTDSGVAGVAAVPSGASTGEHEAVELRDKDMSRYHGKGVLQAVANANGPLLKAIRGEEVTHQQKIDRILCEVDGTPNKSRMGANAILGISLAVAQAAAHVCQLPLYRYIAGTGLRYLPCPMMNIINGGAHANNSIDFQEFMIRPVGAESFREAVRWGAEIFHTLKKLLQEEGYVTSVGDEGGFAPSLSSNEAALDIMLRAVEKAGYRPQEEITFALDCAASELFDKESSLYLEKKKKKMHEDFAQRTSEEQADYLFSLVEKYPIDSIEDGLDENDWKGWSYLNQKIGDSTQIVGDDIFVTNKKFLMRGIEEKAANSILIKVNQIGTLSETLETIEHAHKHGFTTVISHRSGETEDNFIADLSVAVNSGQIKTGSLCRTDRIVKYNRLMAIEDELGSMAAYFDSNRFSGKRKGGTVLV